MGFFFKKKCKNRKPIGKGNDECRTSRTASAARGGHATIVATTDIVHIVVVDIDNNVNADRWHRVHGQGRSRATREARNAQRIAR
jgi:hypothetical protein